MIEERLKKIDSKYEIISRFMGGMSNFTYKVKDDKENLYVYRFPGRKNYNFVNYDEEKIHLKEIEKLNISNEVVFLEPSEGLKISKYVEGENIGDDVDLELVSSILKKLHNSDVKFKDYDHLGRLKKYETLHTNDMEEYFKLKEEFLKIYDTYLKKHIKYPAHNDSQVANFIQTPSGDIKLLDWEYAGVNDYIYDIACFGNADFNMAKKLLSVYEDDVNDEKLIRLYGWRMFQCLQWFNVASFKEDIGLSKDLGVDFKMVSKKYISLANEFLNNIKTFI